ncbi:hypothetical protein [Maridesulfovibrio sp.]|uniref:hypothetical protein n=1 Tax=Maridesulfovibrio sp. TaxID=2795000 RepID=UPI0029CAAA39|nr:hypothetical protein [Maridesulfovibrio sp.]
MRIGSTLGNTTNSSDPNSYLGNFTSAMRARRAKQESFQNFCQSIEDKKNFSTSATNRAPKQPRPQQPHRYNPEVAIQKVVQTTAAYLDFKVGQIFENDKSKLLSGKPDSEYQNSLKQLTKAIDGQDYDNAHKILEKFYKGDSDQVIAKIEKTLDKVEDKFWGDIKKVLGQMREVQGLTLSEGVADQNAISGYDIIDKAIENARHKNSSLSDTDFSSLLSNAREDSINYAVNRLKNEDKKVQNTTDAEETIQSVSVYTKHFLFNSQSYADKFTDNELAVSSQVERSKDTTKAMRVRRHIIHNDNRFSQITDEEIARSAGLSMARTSQLGSKIQKMGDTVIDELGDLLSKSKRENITPQAEELSETDKKSFEMNVPEEIVINEDWKTKREDLMSLMVEETLSYSRKMTARRKNQQHYNTSTSSFSFRV